MAIFTVGMPKKSRSLDMHAEFLEQKFVNWNFFEVMSKNFRNLSATIPIQLK
jgi:hypothetical protein